MNPIIKEIEKEYLNANVPEMAPGDSVDVHTKIVEGGKERVQIYKGVVIKVQNGGVNKSVTVRRIFQGVGIERTFPIHSPRIAKIVVTKKGHVRRAKLYYLRDLTGKATRIQEKEAKPAKA